jgi:gliding motility-associated protein GldM
MGANGNVARMSPRQKMINLMYIVLTAMLALNVSSDVLNGFTLVEDGLKRTNSNVSDRNAALYMQLEEFTRQNPQKGKPWLDKAADVRRQTLSLYKYIDSLKLAIVRDADGGTYTVCEIEKALTFFSRKKGLDTVFISFNLAHDAAILF